MTHTDALIASYRCLGKVAAYREVIDWWSDTLRALPSNGARREGCPEFVQQFLKHTYDQIMKTLAEAKTMEPLPPEGKVTHEDTLRTLLNQPIGGYHAASY